MKKVVLYYWFKNVDPARPGGPWWGRAFDSEETMNQFLFDARPFLYRWAVDRETGKVLQDRDGTVRPPKNAEVYPK